MRPQQRLRPSVYSLRGSDLPLSAEALLELMRGVLARGVPLRFRAKGWSMAPFIRDGDVISVAPLGPALPGLGEVVAFVHPEIGKLVVHRVVARRGGGLLIQGDNLPGAADGLVPRENLLGRVTAVQRGGRKVWLGLGPERFLIALLSRVGLLATLRGWVGPLLRSLKRSTP